MSAIERPKVGAVIVSYHPDGLLFEAMAAVRSQVDRVWVVDNGSNGEICHRLECIAGASGGRIAVILNGDNVGLAAAQNIGIERALAEGCDWVLLLDHDSVPEPDMVATLLRQSGAAGRPVGLLAPRLYNTGIHLKFRFTIGGSGWRLRRGNLAPGEVRDDLLYAIASGSLIRAEALRRIGLMRSAFFIDYVDIEFCLRLRAAGYAIVGVGSAGLRHRFGAAVRRRRLGLEIRYPNHPPRRRYFIHRNRIRVLRGYGRQFPAFAGFELAIAVYDMLRALTVEDDKRAKLAAILGGIRDGFARKI